MLGAQAVEGVAIYLWLAIPGAPTPMAYELPWSKGMAEQLQQAQAQAEANGTGVKMKMPFEATLDTGEVKFYALPQPQLPLKPLPEPPLAVPEMEA